MVLHVVKFICEHKRGDSVPFLGRFYTHGINLQIVVKVFDIIPEILKAWTPVDLNERHVILEVSYTGTH